MAGEKLGHLQQDMDNFNSLLLKIINYLYFNPISNNWCRFSSHAEDDGQHDVVMAKLCHERALLLSTCSQ